MTAGSEINQAFGLALNISAKMAFVGWPPISARWNRDVSSASDPIDMSLTLGVNFSAAYEICDKRNGYLGTLSVSTWFTCIESDPQLYPPPTSWQFDRMWDFYQVVIEV